MVDYDTPTCAVMWRIHKSLGALNPAISVLEVLFLAVCSEVRQQTRGKTLVENLKQIMKEENISILYVEIGDGTPWAIDFWKAQGLDYVIENSVSENRINEMRDRGENVMSSFQSTPFSHFSRQELAFFDSHCLRFRDTVQFAGRMR